MSQENFETYRNVGEQRQQMGELLGLDEPVPEAVFYAALQDGDYAHNLLMSRREPTFLRYLLNNPPPAELPAPRAAEKSEGELLRKASEAVWRWARTGFSTVDEPTFQRRHGACLQCPHLADKPDKFLYKIVSSKSSGEKVCDLCGCLVARKARLTSESCPDQHPTQTGLTRWGEPLGQ
jgi:hypothetical protein